MIRRRIRGIIETEIAHQNKIIAESDNDTEKSVAHALKSLLERLLVHV